MGGILLVRTGHKLWFTSDGDRESFVGMQPGLSYTCAEWAHDKSLAAVAADNMAVELLEAGRLGSEMPLAFQFLALRDMRMPLSEMFNLDALAADLRRRRHSVVIQLFGHMPWSSLNTMAPTWVGEPAMDSAVLKSCIPGCEELEQIEDQRFCPTAIIKVRPVSGWFKGKTNLSDLDPPNAT